ncbi:Lysozyme-like protein 6 [Cricetulus griseus]|uniref:Lysozyme-like protein 6 n=2 Tax=Cricetulus griseus TaxID=10029 RepID=G3IPM6_CRIGR|nr:Lysozyme-like protein 6 [Cricetulus griseus]
MKPVGISSSSGLSSLLGLVLSPDSLPPPPPPPFQSTPSHSVCIPPKARASSLFQGLCLAFVESNFNISKVTENVDGSFDYGIFQINSHYWCNDYQSHSENFCHIDCQELLSPNLITSIHCAKKIVSGSGGMKNW